MDTSLGELWKPPTGSWKWELRPMYATECGCPYPGKVWRDDTGKWQFQSGFSVQPADAPRQAREVIAEIERRWPWPLPVATPASRVPLRHSREVDDVRLAIGSDGRWVRADYDAGYAAGSANNEPTSALPEYQRGYCEARRVVNARWATQPKPETPVSDWTADFDRGRNEGAFGTQTFVCGSPAFLRGFEVGRRERTPSPTTALDLVDPALVPATQVDIDLVNALAVVKSRLRTQVTVTRILWVGCAFSTLCHFLHWLGCT